MVNLSTHVFDPDLVRVVIGFRAKKKQINMFFLFAAFGHTFGNDFLFVIAERIHVYGDCWIVLFETAYLVDGCRKLI
jgi:hypothetical protein